MKNFLDEAESLQAAVDEQIARGNDWYVGDQAESQLGTPGARMVVENRWRMFGRAIQAWIAGRPASERAVSVLDAGCGDGNNINALRGAVEAAGFVPHIVGVDYNELRLARSRARTAVVPLKTNLLQLPFRENTFDLILCNHVIEHIHDDIGALRELARVIKPDGLVLIGVPNEGCVLAQLRNHVLERSVLSVTDHVHFYTAKLLFERVQQAGLVPRAPIGREGFFFPHFGVVRRLRETSVGRGVMAALAAIFPSQSAGLLLIADKRRTSGL